MESPEFDADGYPTEETLEHIRTYDVSKHPLGPHAGCDVLLKFCQRAWRWESYFEYRGQIKDDYSIREEEQWLVSTGGWSGHEDIISALQENFMFWVLCWFSERRGGHFEFRV